MIGQLLQAAQLVAAVVCFAGIVILVARSALAGAIIVLGTFLLFDATAPPLLELVVQFGTTSVYPIDMVSLALLSVGTWRLVVEDIYGPAKIALVVLVVLLTTNLLWGVGEFGVEHATNQSRFWLTIISGVVYGATVRSWDRRLPTVFIVSGCFLAAVSIVRVFQHGLYSATTFIDVGGNSVDARPVMALGVLVILNALIMVLARGAFTLVTAALALLLTTGLVLLQYRTLWVTAVACAVLGLFVLASRYRASNERVVYLVTGLMLLAVPAALYAISQVSVYQRSAESATGATSTFTWRIEAWKTLLEKHSSPFDLAFGTPSGSGREIVIDGWATNLSAHNLYVESILQFGLIGFAALCAIAWLAFSARERSAAQLELATPAVVILLVSVLMVAITHSPAQVHGLLLGVVLSAACFQTQPLRAPRVDLAAQRLAPSR